MLIKRICITFFNTFLTLSKIWSTVIKLDMVEGIPVDGKGYPSRTLNKLQNRRRRHCREMWEGSRNISPMIISLRNSSCYFRTVQASVLCTIGSLAGSKHGRIIRHGHVGYYPNCLCSRLLKIKSIAVRSRVHYHLMELVWRSDEASFQKEARRLVWSSCWK